MLRREHYNFQVVPYLNNFSNHWTIKIPSLPIKAFSPIKKQTSLGVIIILIASVSQLTEFTTHLSIFSGPCLFSRNLFIFPPQLQLVIIRKKNLPSSPWSSALPSVSHPTSSQKQVLNYVSRPSKVQCESSVYNVCRYSSVCYWITFIVNYIVISSPFFPVTWAILDKGIQ